MFNFDLLLQIVISTQRAEFERRKLEFEKELRERTVRVGRRQLAAREWWVGSGVIHY